MKFHISWLFSCVSCQQAISDHWPCFKTNNTGQCSGLSLAQAENRSQNIQQENDPEKNEDLRNKNIYFNNLPPLDKAETQNGPICSIPKTWSHSPT
jgi:hypothetical protein